MKQLSKQAWEFFHRASFAIPVILTALFSYGFQIVNTAISVDDLKRDVYMGGVSAAQGRFSSPVFKYFFGLTESFPFFEKLFSVLLLMLAATVLCVCIRRAARDKLHEGCYTLFACLMIFYPLLCEIFAFRASDYETALGWLLCAICVYTMQCFQDEKKKGYVITSALILTIIIALTEQFVLLYITAVICILLLQCVYGEQCMKLKEVLCTGLWFALPLVVGIIAKIVVAELVVAIFSIPPTSTGENSIMYFTWEDSFFDLFLFMMFGIAQNYVIHAFWYFPITIYLLCVCIGLFFVFYHGIKKRWTLSILWLGLLFSTVVLTFVQGWVSPYRTVCVPLAVFCAFVLMLLFQRASKLQIRSLRLACCVLLCMICFWQAGDMNKWSTVNYMRYEEEVAVVRQMYADLCRTVTDQTKPVVFVGEYELSDNIKQYTCISSEDTLYQELLKLRCDIFSNDYEKLHAKAFPEGQAYGVKFTQTNAQSVLSWAVGENSQAEMFKFLLRHGIVLTAPTEEMVAEAYVAAAEQAIFPTQGNIVETDAYIIVKLGDFSFSVKENNPFIFG